MKKIGKFLVVAILGIITFACSNNDEDDTNPPVTTDGAIVEFTLTNPSTRSDDPIPGTDDENKVYHLEAYVSQSDGVVSQYKRFDEESEGNRYSMVIDTPEPDMKFLIAINQDLGELTGMSYENALKIISNAPAFIPFSATEGNTLVAPEKFPMAGWATGDVTKPDGKEASITLVAVEMNRLHSKVEAPQIASDFKVTISDDNLKLIFPDKVPKNGVSFEMQGFTFINGVDRTDAFYTWNNTGIEANEWNTWSRIDKNNLASTYDEKGFYTSVYAGAVKNATSDMFMTNSNTIIYLHENRPQENNESAPDGLWKPTSVCSFIIKGILRDNDDYNNTQTRYWRANLGLGENYRVFRNSIYRMTLKEVNSVGSSTPKGAEEIEVPKQGNASIVIRIDIKPWKVRSFNNIIL